ncbi:MAG TPA: hypothetical protein DEP57_05235 [Selenomonas sp.]|nr:hypothetical protein [Selenomonas sp.]
MAALKVSETTSMGIKVLLNGSGDKNVYATRTVGKINPSLTDDDFALVANGLGSLQKYPVANIIRTNAATFLTEGE